MRPKRQKLNEENIPKEMQIFKYVLSDTFNGFPKVTVVTGKLNQVYCRGLCVCASDEEPFGYVESEGVQRATRRMLRAFNKEVNTLPVLCEKAEKIISTVRRKGLTSTFFLFKSQYHVDKLIGPEFKNLFWNNFAHMGE